MVCSKILSHNKELRQEWSHDYLCRLCRLCWRLLLHLNFNPNSIPMGTLYSVTLGLDLAF